MKQIILGTAGHIDHGKTSLIKAVSGTDTDRLVEEKRRGITIELGFASIDLPSGLHIGVVDVPGHEKFVKNMVAGATGIDVVAMVIAADEGVMPQTREHMEICSLLGIHYGFVVLTKVDMVDEEWLELVQEDVADFMAGTFLEDASIVPVSSITGEGVDEMLKVLDDYCQALPERPSSGLFRLPIDRVFSMKGFGTVITGTLISGKIKNGEPVMIYPSGITSKIRGLQVHDKSVEESEAGLRTAVNFQGIDRHTVNRGDVLARPGTLISSYMLDIELQLLESNARPLKNRARVRLHIGTSQMPCNVILLDREVLEPGDTAPAQLRLKGPIGCMRDDRYVIRSYSPVRTLGGGMVLNPVPPKHKRLRPDVIDRLERMKDASPEALTALHIEIAEYREVSFRELVVLTHLTDKALENTLQKMMSDKVVIQTERSERRFIHAGTFEAFKSTAVDILTRYHRNNPLKGGMSKGELRSKFPDIKTDRLFNQLLSLMLKSGDIEQVEDSIRIAGHRVTLESDMTALKDKIMDQYTAAGLQPPTFKDLCRAVGADTGEIKKVLMHLVEDGQLIKVKEDLFFHKAAIEELKNRLVAYLSENEDIDTPRFKELTGASRKYTIPLLEHFDAANVTLRVGDTRKLRRKVS